MSRAASWLAPGLALMLGFALACAKSEPKEGPREPAGDQDGAGDQGAPAVIAEDEPAAREGSSDFVPDCRAAYSFDDHGSVLEEQRERLATSSETSWVSTSSPA